MFKLFKSIFTGFAQKIANYYADNENTETKKCLHCLRRYNSYLSKCPYCRTDKYHY